MWEADVLTATATLVGSVVGLLTAVGAGLGFLIRQADKKRELGEARMVEHYKEQLRKAEAEIRWLKKLAHARLLNGAAWREQLIRNDIEPQPKDWTEVPEVDH